MVLTPSKMLDLGTSAPAFSLPDPGGGVHALSDFSGKPLVVVFMCNHCPYVKHLKTELSALFTEFQDMGVGCVGINSNDVAHYPDDHPTKMADDIRTFGYTFPYLYDETQAVARAYQAACTPDFYVFNADHQLVYRGQFDDSRPGNGLPVTGADLRAAVEAVVAGQPVAEVQKPSIGCNVKWKS